MSTKRLGHSIIECGRGNFGKFSRRQRARGYRRWKVVDKDFVPGPRKGDGVELRDKLAPLYRWILSKIGQPFSKVYSEFCSKEDKRSLRGDHIHTHFKQYVGMGRRYYGGWSEYRPLCENLAIHGYSGIFVDDDGILSRHTDKDCWKFSEEHGHPKPKPVPRPKQVPKVNEKPVAPKPDPITVLKARKLERNRIRRGTLEITERTA